MRKRYIVSFFVFVTYFLLLNNSFAQYPIMRAQLNGNNIATWFQNTGIFNQDTRSGNSAGFEWPKGSNKFAIFSTGLTIAGYYNNSLRMGSAFYKGEYYTGYCNAGIATTNSNFHIYKVSLGDNEYNNPDYANWGLMVPYGAPYNDSNHNGIFELGIDIPGVKNAYQTVFMCLTDGFTSRHDPLEGFGGGTAPLFSEVHMTAWCYYQTDFQDVDFIKWDVINKGNYAWDSTIFSIVCDPDLGTANDDYIGCDTTRKLGYCYNSTDNDAMYGLHPPAVGIAILHGAVDKYVIPNQNKGMSSFDYFTNPSVTPPPCESDPSPDTTGAYRYMSGFKKDLTRWLNPTILSGSRKTKYCFTGDLQTMTGWTENAGSIHNCGGDTTGIIISPNPAGDRRFLMNSGKIKVNPGDTQMIMIAQLIARDNTLGYNNKTSVAKLKIFTDSVTKFYNRALNVGLKNTSSMVPGEFSLYQNYPNPFNPETKIKFDIPETVKRKTLNVKLIVYDILGKEIATLVNESLQPGTYEVEFNGENYPSGIYFYRLETSDFVQTKKMLMIK